MAPLLWSASPAERESGPVSAPAKIMATARSLPPVMQKLESADSGVLQLPVAAPVSSLPAPAKPETPSAAAGKEPHAAVSKGPANQSKSKPKTTQPEEFLLDSGSFCQKKIGQWTLAEARVLLGDPVRDRPAT